MASYIVQSITGILFLSAVGMLKHFLRNIEQPVPTFRPQARTLMVVHIFDIIYSKLSFFSANSNTDLSNSKPYRFFVASLTNCGKIDMKSRIGKEILAVGQQL